MAGVTSRMVYDLACAIRDQLDECARTTADIKGEIHAIRGLGIAIQQDINGIYALLARHEAHFDRIEQHLGLRL